jgi:hypothetical protein
LSIATNKEGFIRVAQLVIGRLEQGFHVLKVAEERPYQHASTIGYLLGSGHKHPFLLERECGLDNSLTCALTALPPSINRNYCVTVCH